MSVLKKFTNEQIAAFQECKTQEELIAKANELGIEYKEEDLKEAAAKEEVGKPFPQEAESLMTTHLMLLQAVVPTRTAMLLLLWM